MRTRFVSRMIFSCTCSSLSQFLSLSNLSSSARKHTTKVFNREREGLDFKGVMMGHDVAVRVMRM